jgi:hypothetical protein
VQRRLTLRKQQIFPLLLTALVVVVLAASAHPHFTKTVTAKLPSGAELTLTYNTVPSNETRATGAAVGSFQTPGRPILKISAELKAGAVVIPAGEYSVGVIKNGDRDWVMALLPGQIPRGQTADLTKLIKLESAYSDAEGKAPHMLIDIAPGAGKLEGKAVLTIHFGSMFLAGVLS